MSTKSLAAQLAKLPQNDCLLVEVRGYKNKKGAVSNYVFNAGMSYEEGRQADITYLEAWTPTKSDIKDFTEKLEKAGKTSNKTTEEILLEAKDALLSSLKKDNQETKNRSDAQVDAYEQLGPVTRKHIESGEVFIKGLFLEKDVIVEGPATKPVNSGIPVRAKNFIGKNLKTKKYVQFSLDQLSVAKLSDDKKTLIIQ